MGNLIADAVFVFVALLIIIIFTKRGFIRNLIESFKLILAVGAAYLWGTDLGRVFSDQFLAKRVHSFVFEKINGLYLSASESLNASSVTDLFPRFLISDTVRDELESTGAAGEEFVNRATDVISAPISTFVSNAIGYIAVFLAALLALSIFGWMLNKLVSKIRILRFFNGLLGFIWGVIVSFFLLLIAGSVIKAMFGTDDFYTQSAVVRFFGESATLELLKIFNVGEVWLRNIIR